MLDAIISNLSGHTAQGVFFLLAVFAWVGGIQKRRSKGGSLPSATWNMLCGLAAVLVALVVHGALSVWPAIGEFIRLAISAAAVLTFLLLCGAWEAASEAHDEACKYDG